jgi:S1-C subfamily serine protease
MRPIILFLLTLISFPLAAFAQRLPRLDTFLSPDRTVAIDLHSQDNGWGEVELYLRNVETDQKQKFGSFEFPIQGAPVWSTDGKTVLIHTGTLSAGIWAQIYRLQPDGSARSIYDLIPPKFWKRAIAEGHVPKGAEPSHVYIRGNYFDDDTKSLWCVVSGDVSVGNRQVPLKAFVLSFAQPSFKLSFAERLPRPPTKAPAVRMASEGFRGSGTGFFVSSDGHIVTCAHVIDRATAVKIDTNEGALDAEVLAKDDALDVAVLKVSPTTPPRFLLVGESKAVALGAPVFTIGFPNPALQGFSPKYTRGEISSLRGLADSPTMFQISAPVQSGNSGGPLVAETGVVIGLVSAKLDLLAAARATGDFPQNVNFAVKSNQVLDLLRRLHVPISETVTKEKPSIAEVEKAVVRVSVYGR